MRCRLVLTMAVDLEACVWLEEELKTYEACLVIVSHSQDFLNGVCTNIMHLQNKQVRSNLLLAWCTPL